MNAEQRRQIFQRFEAADPHPTTELEYTTPFELLIAVILSAQATDVSVNKATRHLFPVASTPARMLALGVDGLMPYISTINFYPTKAKHVIETCRRLLDEYGGQVPRSREALQTLPGVGRKTANVVLNTIYAEAAIPVDTHIFRVANRTGIAPGKTVEVVEQQLMRLVPPEFQLHAHHWLILHGRYTCIARKPKCWNCMIADLCEYQPKTPLPEQGV